MLTLDRYRWRGLAAVLAAAGLWWVGLAPDRVVDGSGRTSQVPPRLAPIGAMPIEGMPRDIVVAGSHAYVAADDAGLRVIDVSNPATPHEVTAVDDWVASKVVSSRGWIFVVNDGAGDSPWVDDILNVLDVTNPAAPLKGPGYALAGETMDLALTSDFRLFAAMGRESPHPRDGWLMRTWVLDMRSPILANTLPALEPPANQLAVGAEQLLYSSTSAPVGGGESTSRLLIMDISDVSASRQVGEVELPGAVFDLAVAGGFVYAATRDHLAVVDVSVPARAALVAQLTEYPSVYPLAVAGRCLYSGRGVLDISDPSQPVEVGRWPGVITAVDPAGELAFVVDAGGLSIFEAVRCGEERVSAFLPIARHEVRNVTERP